MITNGYIMVIDCHSMSHTFECHNCGEHFPIKNIEKHVKEIHFWK